MRREQALPDYQKMDTIYAGHHGGVGVRASVTSYGAGCGCGSYDDVSMVDRMMLKFRPIAPKPVASGSGSSDLVAKKVGRRGRGNRSVRVKRNENNTKRKARMLEKVSGGGEAVVTLSLMPETPTGKDNWPTKNISSPLWLCVKNSKNNNTNNNQTSRDGHVMLRSNETPQRVSFATVDGVTETTVGSELEDRTEMDKDTCPRFISDGGDRVVWANKAYKEMAAGAEEVVVVLVRKDGGWPAAFTCSVRVTCRIGMGRSTLTVPCDAWMIEGGGYAWRLDVKAALCLGR